MATNRIYFADDGYTDEDPNGAKAIPNISGVNPVYVYFCSHCDYTPSVSNPNPVLNVGAYLYGTSSDFVYRLKTVVRAYNASGGSYDVATAYSSESDIKIGVSGFYIFRPSKNGSEFFQPQRGFTRSNYYATKTSLSLSGENYTIQLVIQYRTFSSDTWDDGVYFTYNGFAPLGLGSYTVPGTVYLNSLNTYTLTIPGVLSGKTVTSSFKLGTIYGTSQNYPTTRVPVRNADQPYITSGTTTSNIYWCPQISVNAKANDDTKATYSWTLKLSVTLSQQNGTQTRTWEAIIAEQTVSGDAYWLASDDTSMITASVAFSESTGTFNNYGYLLRNIGSVLTASLTVTAQYGASFSAEAIAIGESSYSVLYAGDTSGTYSVTMTPEDVSTASETVYLRVVSYSTNPSSGAIATTVIYSTSQQFNILDYSMPTVSLDVYRCDEDGISDDQGEYARIEWVVSIASIDDQNSKALTITHPAGTTTYDPLTSYTQTSVLIVAASTESSYTITATVTDDFNTFSRAVKLSTAAVIRDIMAGGKGVAYGKVAEISSALEVTSDWKLIFYKALANGTDLISWMSEMAERMEGIEQFASNLGSTSQYQVTFYNDYTLYDRQWVRTGANAIAPSVNPTKETTKQYVYAFAGWALTRGATSADSSALLNITAYRSIYAAYVATTREYEVNFYNGDDLLETVTNIAYGGSATYSGSAPTSEEGTFFAFLPQPTFVETNMDCYASYYDSTAISDDWDTILEKCRNGTAGDEYKVGQTKSLTLTNGNTTTAKLIGIRKDIISGMQKAELTWICVSSYSEPITSKYNSSSVISPVYGIVNKTAFTVTKTSTQVRIDLNFGAAGTSKATFKITTSTSGKLRGLGYFTGGQKRTLKFTFDGVTVCDLTDGSSGGGNIIPSSISSVTYSAGQEITCTIESTLLDDSYAYKSSQSVYVYITGATSGSSYFYIDTDNSDITAEESDGLYRIESYENGAGGVGGWEYSLARTTCKESIWPLLPENIQNGIKTVKKASKAWISGANPEDAYGDAILSYETIYTRDQVWIPSLQELFGAHSGDLSGEAEYGVPGLISFQYASWLRDVSSSSKNLAYSHNNNSGYTTNSIITNLGLPICFCT